MKKYIQIISLAYPLTEADIKAANPNTSFSMPFVPPPEWYAEVNPANRPTVPAGHKLVEGTPTKQANGKWYEVWATVPMTPAEQADANAATAAALAAAKVQKNNDINAARLVANRSTFMHAGKKFQCDELSRSDIDGVNGWVALYGALPPWFPGAWKAADNTYYPLPNVSAWKSFYNSMATTGAMNFGKAQQLKAALAAATTIEQVNAITWS